jgi:hypothetical protein
MMEDPLAAQEGIKEYRDKLDSSSSSVREISAALVNGYDTEVLSDVLEQKGLLQSLPWLRNLGNPQHLIVGALASEVKEFGGMALFLRVEQEFRSSDGGSNELMMNMLDETGYMRIAEGLPVSDAQALLDYVSSSADKDKNRAMMLGFATSGKDATAWLLDQFAKGAIAQEYATSVAQGLGHQVLSFNDMDLDMRIAARRYTQGNEKKDRDSIVG